MAVYEVAHMVAKLGVESAAFETRLTKLEEMLVQTANTASKSAEGIDKSWTDAFSSAARESAEFIQRNEKGLANLQEFEYKTGQKSTQDYLAFLSERRAGYDEYTNEWRNSAVQTAQIEKKLQAEITREAEVQSSIRFNILKAGAIAAGGAWKTVLRDMEMHHAMDIVTSPTGLYSTSEREAASARIVQLSKEEALISERVAKDTEAAILRSEKNKLEATVSSIRDRETAISNLAKFEYEQGILSGDAYRVFLQRKMADYTLYSTEWKAASTQLLGVERDMELSRARTSSEANASLLAKEKEIGAERLAFERELDAMMGSSYYEFVTKVGADASKLAANRAKANINPMGSMIGGVGNMAAGITGIEAAAGAFAANFNHSLVGIANNTLMTDKDIQSMKETVLRLGKESGASFEDLQKASMWVNDYAVQSSTAADNVNTLTWANKEAVATLSQTEGVAKSLAVTLSIFGANSKQAAGYIDVLHHAAAEGGMTVQQFADHAGPALAIAAAMKDSFYDAAAAMSALSRAGFNTPEVSTQIKSLYAHIGDPTNEATKYIQALQKAFKENNPKSNIDLMFDFSQAGIQLKGIIGLLKDIQVVSGGKADIIAKMVPALRGGIGGMTLAQALGPEGNEVEKSKELLKKLQMENAGSETQSVYDRMMKDDLQKWKALANTIESKFIPVGEKAVQIFVKMEPMLERVADATLSVMNAFQRLPQPVQEVITLIGGAVLIQKFTGIFSILTKIPVAVAAMGKGLAGAALDFEVATTAGAGFAEAIGAIGIGAAAPVVLIVAALATAAYGVYRLKEAFEDAAKSTKDYGDMLTEVSLKGERGALLANREQIADLRADLEKRRDQSRAEASGTTNLGDGRLNSFFNFGQTKENSTTYADTLQKQINQLNIDYKKESDRLYQLNDESKLGSSAIGTAGAIGTKAALAADVEKANSSAHNCQQRARQIIQTATSQFDGLFAARDDKGRVTARSVAEAMLKAGVLQPYTPGMKLNPGSLLYSTTLDPKGDAGHVQAIDNKGNRRDQYGSNKFGEKNFQYFFDPDYAAARMGTGSPSIRPVTNEDLQASIARTKAAESEKKRIAHLEKVRDQHYTLELSHLGKLIALDTKSQDLETNLNRKSVEFDLSNPNGALYGIHGKKAQALRELADRQDYQEHQKYVDNIIDKSKGRALESSAPTNVKEAINDAGIDWDKWNALGRLGKPLADGFTEAQHRLLNFSAQIELAAVGLKARKAREDAVVQSRLSLPENRALKDAVEAAGGMDSWKRLGQIGMGPADAKGRNSQQEDYINQAVSKFRASSDKFLLDQNRDVDTRKDEYTQGFNKQFNPRSYDAGQLAVDKWRKSNREQLDFIEKSKDAWAIAERVKLKATEERIREQAEYEENYDSAKFLLQSQIQLKTSAMQTSHVLSDLHKPLMKTVHDWEDSNHEALERIRTNWGWIGDAAIQAYEEELKAQTIAQKTVDLTLQTQQLKDKFNSEQVASRVYNNPGDKAVAEYLASDQGLNDSSIAAADATGEASRAQKTYEDQLRSTTNAEDELSKAIQRRQALIGGLADGIMASILKGFSPDPQATGQEKTKLYDLESQKMQYQMDQMRWKQQYNADPNDPYIKRLKDIQAEIDKTQHKLSGMGNSMSNVFSRVFGGIYDTFKQTLTKIAQAYMQSQLLTYLTRQVGTGAGFMSGGGGGGFLGGITSLIGTVLGGMSGGKGGGWKGIPYALPHAANGWEVPGAEGLGDIVPAMLAPREMVLPVPLANKIRSMTDGKQVVNNYNNFNQTVNTPDAQGFRSSKTTIFQGARRAFGTR